MKSIYFALILFFLALPGYCEELVTRTMLNGKVSLLAPNDFVLMKKEILELKYPSSRRPTEVLSDATGGVTLAFNHTQDKMRQDQVVEAHKTMSKMFHNLYPSAKWIQDKTITKDGMNFMVLELITPAVDTKIYNILYGTSVDNRFLLIAFNTTVEQSNQWLSVGKKIMSSIKLIKKTNPVLDSLEQEKELGLTKETQQSSNR